VQSRTRQVAKHNTKIDCWVSVAAEVLKVTNFLPEHPGGEFAILTFAGEDDGGARPSVHTTTTVPPPFGVWVGGCLGEAWWCFGEAPNLPPLLGGDGGGAH